MKKLGIFWGSNTGATEEVVGIPKENLEAEGLPVDEYDVASCGVDRLMKYDKIIIACPTWNVGELQDDWDGLFHQYKELDFTGKTAAFMGLGNQVGYSDNFVDAIGILAKPSIRNGGILLGR